MNKTCFIYFLLLFSFLWMGSSIPPAHQKLAIALIPIDGKKIKEARFVQKTLEAYYHANVEILDPIELSEEWFANDSVSGHQVLADLSNIEFKDSYDKHIALTNRPLILSRSYQYYIRGLGTLGGKSAVISTHKIYLESEGDRKFYRKLLTQVSRHEVGHMLGLGHCHPLTDCLMVPGTNDSIFYNAKTELCSVCRSMVPDSLLVN